MWDRLLFYGCLMFWRAAPFQIWASVLASLGRVHASDARDGIDDYSFIFVHDLIKMRSNESNHPVSLNFELD